MKKPVVELLKDKYPDGYIEHYLAMYRVHREGHSNEDFEAQNNLYIEFEGKQEFQNLRTEIIRAKQHVDFDRFLQLAIFYEIKGMDLDNLKRMFEAIERFES